MAIWILLIIFFLAILLCILSCITNCLTAYYRNNLDKYVYENSIKESKDKDVSWKLKNDVKSYAEECNLMY